MSLDREALLKNIPKPVVTEVDLPEFGGSVFVRSLTVGEQDRLYSYQRKMDDGKVAAHGWRALYIALGVCDSEGKRLFTDADANAISSYPAGVVERLVDAIDKASGVTFQAREDTAKN